MCQGSEELSRRASKTCSRCVAPHVRMELMRRRSHAVLVLLAWLPCAAPVATQDRSSIPSSAEAPSGSPAPEPIVAEIRLALDAAISRFTGVQHHAQDAVNAEPGVPEARVGQFGWPLRVASHFYDRPADCHALAVEAVSLGHIETYELEILPHRREFRYRIAGLR